MSDQSEWVGWAVFLGIAFGGAVLIAGLHWIAGAITEAMEISGGFYE